MKKFLKTILVIAILAGIAFGIKAFLHKTENSIQAGVLVSTKVIRATIAKTISATGSLKPVDQVEIGTQVSGDIAKIYVDFNTKVQKGQVIAELDKSKLKATLDQVEIAYKSAENDFDFKQKTFERTKKLATSNSASAVELENAEYNMNAAKLSVQRARYEVDQARLNLSYATIKSPIDGVILERAVDVGQTVAASMSTPTLFIIAKDLSQMKVMADVDEADIGQVKAGQRVTFSVDAFQNDTFEGSVQEVRLNPTTTSNVVTYTVVISASNPDQKLLPGMTATCTIITEEITDAIAIPMKALKFSPISGMPEKSGPPRFEGMPKMPFNEQQMPHKLQSQKRNHVWININGKAELRRIKTGLDDGVNVQILDGLNIGDSVIVSQEFTTATKPKKEQNTSPFMPGPPGKKKKK